jgi:predicted outer membrane repeat protein
MVDSGGSLRARWTSFESNYARHDGGAIKTVGYAFLDRVSIYMNNALFGGGIYMASEAGTGFWMESSSVLDNTASAAGGGVFAAARSFNGMVHSTVTGNAAPEGGGYYQAHHDEMLFAYSILAGNIDSDDPTARDASPDCRGQVSTDGVNLFGAIAGFGAGASECWGYDVGQDLIGTVNNPLDPELELVRISTDANSRGDGGELAYRRPTFRSPALDVRAAGTCVTNHDMIRENARSGQPCDLGAIER